MAKMTDKALKKLSKQVASSQEENAKLIRKLEKKIVEALEAQADANRAEIRELQSYLQTHQDAHADDVDQSHEDGRGTQASQNNREAEEHEVTEPAARKAEELGVDADEVEGTGSGERVLVKDVERSAKG